MTPRDLDALPLSVGYQEDSEVAWIGSLDGQVRLLESGKKAPMVVTDP